MKMNAGSHCTKRKEKRKKRKKKTETKGVFQHHTLQINNKHAALEDLRRAGLGTTVVVEKERVGKSPTRQGEAGLTGTWWRGGVVVCGGVSVVVVVWCGVVFTKTDSKAWWGTDGGWGRPLGSDTQLKCMKHHTGGRLAVVGGCPGQPSLRDLWPKFGPRPFRFFYRARARKKRLICHGWIRERTHCVGGRSTRRCSPTRSMLQRDG